MFVFAATIGFFLALTSADQNLCTKPELVGIMRAALHMYPNNPGAATVQICRDAQKHFNGGHWSVVILGPYDYITSSFSLPSKNFCETFQGNYYIAMAGPFYDSESSIESKSGKSRSGSVESSSEESPGAPSGSRVIDEYNGQEGNNRTEEAALILERKSFNAVHGISPLVFIVIICAMLIGIANIVVICCCLRGNRRKSFNDDVVVRYDLPPTTTATPSVCGSHVSYESVKELPPQLPPKPTKFQADKGASELNKL